MEGAISGLSWPEAVESGTVPTIQQAGVTVTLHRCTKDTSKSKIVERVRSKSSIRSTVFTPENRSQRGTKDGSVIGIPTFTPLSPHTYAIQALPPRKPRGTCCRLRPFQPAYHTVLVALRRVSRHLTMIASACRQVAEAGQTAQNHGHRACCRRRGPLVACGAVRSEW